MEEKITGLLLQAIPYLEEKKILKILTAEKGLITLLSNKRISPILSSPFVWAEWVYKISSHPIPFLQDATLLDALSDLKKDFSRINIAGQIAKDLLRTQLPAKNAHEPLLLALACYRKLSTFQEPSLLGAAFRLKLLLLEGVLDIQELNSPLLQMLALSRSFHEIATLPLQKEDIDWVSEFFTTRISL
jgi:recombinational DNA repair protein (RecF pathway)